MTIKLIQTGSLRTQYLLETGAALHDTSHSSHQRSKKISGDLVVNNSINVTTMSMTMEGSSLIVSSYNTLRLSELCFQMQLMSRNTRLVFDINKQGETLVRVFIRIS